MALTDAQLDIVKAGMEAGNPIRTVLQTNGWQAEQPNLVRQQLNTKFTQPVIQNIIQTYIQPNMPSIRLNQIVDNAIGRAGVTVANIDAYIACCQACIVDLQAKKAELEA